MIDSDGFLFITGRIKEILITAGGENVPPVPIEDDIKEELPCVSNAIVVGKYYGLFMSNTKSLNVILSISTVYQTIFQR